MSKEKQIEEMANDIEKSHWKIVQDFMGCHINSEEMAEYLYNAGYRKQSEGEWKLGKSGCMYFCSSCGYSAFQREEEEWNFCPRCGAKMKGDKTDA